MATYDWQLSRLETARVFRPGVEAPPPGEKIDDSITESIWAAAVRLPIETIPVDLPERLLWQIRPAVAMQPGVYAIHWGALDGDSTTEESVYLIGIQAPEAEAEEGLEEEGGDRAGKMPVPARAPERRRAFGAEPPVPPTPGGLDEEAFHKHDAGRRPGQRCIYRDPQRPPHEAGWGQVFGMVFKDRTGEIGGIMWNNAAEVSRQFEVGDVVSVKAKVNSTRGASSFRWSRSSR